MSGYKSCFYCKQNISASEFKLHLKTCSSRGKPKNRIQFGSQSQQSQQSQQQQQQQQQQYGGNRMQYGNYNRNQGMMGGNNRMQQQQQQQQPPPQQMQPNPGQGGGGNNNNQNNNNNNSWDCTMCSFRNKLTDATCNMCRQGKRPASKDPNGGNGNNNPNNGNENNGGQGGGSTWQCPSCTFYNSDVAVSCKICQNPKPKKAQSQPQQQPPPQQQQQQPPQQQQPQYQRQQPPLPPNPNGQGGQQGGYYGQGKGNNNNGNGNNNDADPFADPDHQFLQSIKNPVQKQNFSFQQGQQGGMYGNQGPNGNNNPNNNNGNNNPYGGGEGGAYGNQQQPPPPQQQQNPNSVRAKAQRFQQMGNNNNPNNNGNPYNNNNRYGANNNNNNPQQQQQGYGYGGQPPRQQPQQQQQQNPWGQPQQHQQQRPPQQQQQQPPQQQQQQQPPPQQQPAADDYSQYTGFEDMGLAQMDPDTRNMIIQMLACGKCGKAKADLELNCGHKLCQKCAKKYLFDGFIQKKWEKQNITCPMANCEQQLPDVALKNCGISENMINEIEAQQRKFLVSSDENMTQCPKCKNYFMTESGDVNAFNPKEKGPDNKPLSYEAQKHKAQWRFRCSQCTTIFCGKCKTVPYHLGYSCQAWEAYQNAKKCRFCEKQLISGVNGNEAPKEYGVGPGLDNVCNDGECLKKRSWSCDKIKACGHNCIGMRGERNCMECLHTECVGKNADVTQDEFCNICWVDPLFAAPSIKLECGHYFHFMCVWNKIDRKWPSARITFGFLNCPLCKKEMKHEAITEMAKKYYQLKDQIKKDAIERLKIEGLENDKRLHDKNSQYYNNIEQFALDRLAFYPCSKCKKPYFGGMKACEEAGMEREEKYDQNHLVCGACASGPNSKSCALHGKKYITYKCKFCCSQATWFCWGNTHFCDKCHKKQEKGIYLNRKPISELPKCPGKDLCPLRIEHPPNGVAEFSLGCVVCMRK